MKNKILVIMLVLVLAVVAATGCSAKDPLVGKWEFYDGDGNIVNLEFFQNKTAIQDIAFTGTDVAWFRTKYTYELKDGNLVLKNGEITSDGTSSETEDREPVPYSLDSEILTIGDHFNCGYVRVKEFTNEYLSDGKANPSGLKSGYVFTAGQYSDYFDIPSGAYDLQWVSGNGVCTVGDRYGKISESFGNGENDIKEYRNVKIDTMTKIEVSDTLKVIFVPNK